jgi:hypothetical protein
MHHHPCLASQGTCACLHLISCNIGFNASNSSMFAVTRPAGPADGQEAPSLDSFPAAKAAEVRWWRLQRLKLLALNDRLETSMVSGCHC